MTNVETLTAMGEGQPEPSSLVEILREEGIGGPILQPLPVRLNLGCGHDIREGWVNVDAVARPGVDRVLDLNGPWPWADSSVDEVFCSHTLEHLDSFQHFTNECWRVLKPGAKATVVVPHGRSDRATQDPTHRRIITEASFLYVMRRWREQNGIDYAGFTCDFDPIDYGHVYAPSWQTRSDDARAFAATHYWNVVLDLHVFLTAKK